MILTHQVALRLYRGAQVAAATNNATCAVTLSNDLTRPLVVTGGEVITLTLSNDAWVGAGAAFNAVRQAIIDGLDAASSPTLGWNNEVRDKLDVSAVVRVSGQVVTITLPATASYDIDSDETITVTVPAAALNNNTIDVTATPTFDVAAQAPISRHRGRGRRYRTPAPDAIALEDAYKEIAEAAPPRVVRKLLGDYILRGDLPPQAMPPATAIDWDGLQQDTERVVQLFDAYVEWVEDEEVTTVLLLGEF